MFTKLVVAFLASVGAVHCAIVFQLSSSQRLTGSSFGIPNRNATYDYIIVGSGLAGSVMAARLTEHTNATVAVVEGGNFYELSNGNWSQIPYFSEQWAGSAVDEYNPLVDWGLVTEPQVNGERIHYAQGKNLGGSSGRNQMLYHRPTKGYYQQWADHVDDLSYTWDNMTKYLQRSMTFHPPNDGVRGETNTPAYDASVYLPSGNMSNPLQVSYPAYVQPFSAYAPAAFSNIGLTYQPGFSSGVLHGYGYCAFTIDPAMGTRSSSESSFLQQAFNRDSFTAYINTRAQNVLFDASNTAIGVNVTSSWSAGNALYYTLTARKEVLLAAGAYHSPQILMLSGIGPRETLTQHNISVISALEGVGQNMWDTTNLGGPVYEINDDIVTFQQWSSNQSMLQQAEQQFLTSASGPLVSEGTDILGWDKLPSNITRTFSNATQAHIASLASDWPEIEYVFATSSRSLETTDSSKKTGSIGALMVGTASRGNMTIRSASIFDSPIINPNWLLDERDHEVAIAAYKRARQAWQGVPEGVRVGDEVFPGKNVTSDADLLEAIMSNIAAIHHASAGCAMGRVGEPDTVVDSKGRVIGVQGLRVVDSSSLPFTNPGHTQGTTYAHAEKLADDVLRDAMN